MVGSNVVLVVFTLVWGVSCITEDDSLAIRRTIRPIVVNCFGKCDVTEAIALKGEGDPCVKKCAAKKLKILDGDNQLDRKILNELFVSHIADEVEAATLQKLYEECYDEANKSVAEDSEAELKRIDILCKCFNIVK